MKPFVAFLFAIPFALSSCGDPSSHDDEVLVGDVENPLATRSATLWKPPPGFSTVLIDTCFINGTTTQRNFVRNNVESSWEAIASNAGFTKYGVDFRGWGMCPATTNGVLRILFDPDADTSVSHGLGTETVSDVNRSKPGVTFLSSQLTASTGASTVIHEFGHVLGFTHEFRRSDYSATDPSCTASQGTIPDLGLGPADTGSIMNYPSCGRTGVLTNADRAGFSFVYGPWVFGSFIPIPIALRRDSTSRFVRVPNNTALLADSPGISASTTLRIDLLDGGVLRVGDRVRFRTSSGRYVAEGSSASGYTVTTTTSASANTAWRVVRSRLELGNNVYVNDEIRLQSNSGRYLNANSSSQLVTTTSATHWRMVGHLGLHL